MSNFYSIVCEICSNISDYYGSLLYFVDLKSICNPHI